MLNHYRQAFNAGFTQAKYEAFVKQVNPFFDPKLDFRLAETPVFVNKTFKAKMDDLFEQIKAAITQPDFARRMEQAVPKRWRMQGENPFPHWVAMDFAVCRNEQGEFVPQIIEIQGVATVFAYQPIISRAYMEHFGIEKLSYLYGGMDEPEYYATLDRIIRNGEDPEHVVLLEIDPHRQKTRIDFHYTSEKLGIKPLDIQEVSQVGSQLFYEKNGIKIPIRRIYNRVIMDELGRRPDLKLRFDLQSELDVEWVAHPHWFFKISKFTLPYINSEYVPETHFLDQLAKWPDDLENWVLKPLFSFAGAGVIFDLKKSDLEAVKRPEDYILQRKVQYEPFLPTPDVPAKAEIRILCGWDGELKPLTNLARLSKGKILGVDFNKDKTWVGASAVLFED